MTTRNVVVSWHDNLTRSDQNDTRWCHSGQFLLDCLAMKLPHFSYCGVLNKEHSILVH